MKKSTNIPNANNDKSIVERIRASLGTNFATISTKTEPCDNNAEVIVVEDDLVELTEINDSIDERFAENYLTSSTTQLLENIKFFPNGDAPKEDNAWNDAYWFVLNRPVGFIGLDTDGYKTIVKLANNPAERYCDYISKKWSFERDWIPDYKYSDDDMHQEVWLAVQEVMTSCEKWEPRDINKLAFKRLDNYYKAIKEYKTEVRTEEQNNGMRYLIAMLFSGNVDTLTKQYAYFDKFGEPCEKYEYAMPTEDDLSEFGLSIDDFSKVIDLFNRVKDRHKSADKDTWVSAQCYVLGMPTDEAVKFIYGDKAKGKKKVRSCKSSYSKHHNDVIDWIVDEVEMMISQGENTDGLDKWVRTITYIRNERTANSMWDKIKRLNLMFVNDDIEEAVKVAIRTNPKKAIEMFEGIFGNNNVKFNDCEDDDFDDIDDDNDEDIKEFLAKAVANGVVLPF